MPRPPVMYAKTLEQCMQRLLSSECVGKDIGMVYATSLEYLCKDRYVQRHWIGVCKEFGVFVQRHWIGVCKEFGVIVQRHWTGMCKDIGSVCAKTLDRCVQRVWSICAKTLDRYVQRHWIGVCKEFGVVVQIPVYAKALEWCM